MLFFVLSGFLVGGKLIERVRNGAFDSKAYALDRISRIYVPLLPALILSAVIGWICGQKLSIRDSVGNCFGLQGICVNALGGNDPLWTLAYEYWFYLLAGFAAVVLVGRSVSIRMLAFGGLVVAFAVFTRFHASLLFCWCLGALSYSFANKDLHWKWFWIGAGLAFFGVGFSQYISSGLHSFGKFLATGEIATLILSMGLAIALAFLARKKPSNRKLAWFEGTGTKLAAFSYTLYLTHHPVLRLWAKIHPEKYSTMSLQSFGWYAIYCSSCLLVAWLLYLPFEAQTVRVRNWLRKKFPG